VARDGSGDVPGGSAGPGAGLGWAAWSVAAAFGTYFCMYAFRKPFTAAAYAGSGGGGGLKTVLVVSQVLGYTGSKFLGIKVASEATGRRRAAVILGLIAAAEAALVAFAVTPPPYGAAMLFANGLALGMVFGLVIGFLEGRRLTEALAAGLCASFILADGVMKSVGTWLLDRGVPEAWMPAAAGALFVPPVLASLGMLTRIPPPSARDVAERSARVPIDRRHRAAFLARHAPVLIPVIAMFLAVTVLRSVRADFAPELWRALGAPAVPEVFTYSETFVALAVLVLCSGCSLFRDNRRAFRAGLLLSLLGALLLPVALVGLRGGRLGAFPFMVVTGLGLYLPYVAVHTTIFERYIALTRERNNLGFLMSCADAVGYLGYVFVMLGRLAYRGGGGFLGFYTATAWVVAAVSALGVAGSWAALRDRPARPEPEGALVCPAEVV
jgi:hypothetical protein